MTDADRSLWWLSSSSPWLLSIVVGCANIFTIYRLASRNQTCSLVVAFDPCSHGP
ncbi:hypothetical protein GQ55_3G445700 [Panicum hallii var. hallii]|uniref:Uncharacterized protein n=1 Tax=Panicum hallii var. hallii TaxID=1504633 RepID=A0A2T7EIA1_9POAL|nr:hypothetical protein GQ55_3G445700 [Panicum hallii var. hallii]